MCDPEQVHRDLTALASILRADAWGALGGEPTLHPQLELVLEAAEESDVADRIELWTNGISIGRMTSRAWSTLDEVVLSRYESKLTDAQVAWIADVCAERQIKLRIMDERTQPNFRTLLEKEPTDESATRSKFAGCFFRHFSRVANDGYFYTCCCAPHMPVLVQGRPAGSDGVAIEGLTEAGLLRYLERAEPLGACSVCAGRDTAVQIAWREEKEPLRWLAASAGLSETSQEL